MKKKRNFKKILYQAGVFAVTVFVIFVMILFLRTQSLASPDALPENEAPHSHMLLSASGNLEVADRILSEMKNSGISDPDGQDSSANDSSSPENESQAEDENMESGVSSDSSEDTVSLNTDASQPEDSAAADASVPAALPDLNGSGEAGASSSSGTAGTGEPSASSSSAAASSPSQTSGNSTSSAPAATVTPTSAPTETPTAAPTAAPTEEPTATPTATPTEEPTATPAATPTETPTAVPTPSPDSTDSRALPIIDGINLKDGDEIQASVFSLILHACDSDGVSLATDKISVTLNGTVVKNGLFNPSTESNSYKLTLKDGENKISITVSDDTGLSTNYNYTVNHTAGPVTVTMSLEATTLSKMLIPPVSVECNSSKPLSYALTSFLSDNGFTWEGSGDLDNFYLSAVDKDGLTDGLSVDSTLLPYLSGQTPTEASQGGRLGDRDFYQDSGWMVEINGSYPSSGISFCYPNEGDVIRMRFTLAGGNDIGASGSNNFNGSTDGW